MFEDLKALARDCDWRELDNVVKQVTRVWADGRLTDDEASYILEGIVGPRRAWREAGPKPPSTRPPESFVGSRPISARSLPARRVLSRETFVRPQDTDALTNGEAAVLTVVIEEVMKFGACRLCVGKLAAIAGVSRRWAQHALGKLATLHFLVVERRPLTRRRHDTNLVTLHPDRVELKARLQRVKKWWRGRGGAAGIGRSLVRSTRVKVENSIALSRDHITRRPPSAAERAAEGRIATAGPPRPAPG